MQGVSVRAFVFFALSLTAFALSIFSKYSAMAMQGYFLLFGGRLL